MLRSPETSFRLHAGLLSASLASMSILVPAGPAAGVDVTLDARDNRQHGSAAGRTFTTYLRRESLTARQGIRLSRAWTLDGRLNAQREVAGGDIGGIDQETERRTYLPDAMLSYATRRLGLGVKGNWLERRTSGTTGLAPETHRFQFQTWLNLEVTSTTTLDLAWNQTRSEEEGAPGGSRETRERGGYVRAEQTFGQSWRLEYQLAGSENDLIQRNQTRTQLSQAVDLRGNRRFAGRLDTSLRVLSQFSRQTTERGAGGEANLLRAPLSAEVILDDTPEVYDPLEQDPTPVPSLADGDRVTPTPVDIGDSAPPVREFGGDYRNLRYDFGQPQRFASAILFVDQRLPNPDLFRWLVFVSDDPEGRLWEELGPDRVRVDYNEWGTVLQGWEVTFLGDVSARWLKLVDVKLGTTVDNLLVTELETYVRAGTGGTETTERGRDHRLEASAGYRLTDRWRVGYDTRLDWRRFDDTLDQEINEEHHSFAMSYQLGTYQLGARHGIYNVSGDARRNSDVRTWHAGITRVRGERLHGSLTWNRTDDGSRGQVRTTDVYSAQTNWRAAPRLRLFHSVSYARRRDETLDVRSSSIAVSNRLRGAPFRALTVELDRADRWASRSAGSGFDRFSDSGATVTWWPVSLVSVTSTTRYQVRGAFSEWNTREYVSWSPVPGGAIQTFLTGDSYYDSRTEVWQYGGGIALRWRVRPGMRADGSVQVRRFELDGEETTPINTNIHVSWAL